MVVTTDAGATFSLTAVASDQTNRVATVTASCAGCSAVPTSTPITVFGAGASSAPVAADFIFELDKSNIVNTGTDQALLTITALDNNRNTLAKVPVAVSVDGGGVFSEGSGLVTNDLGKFTGKINIGNDKSDRTINATMTLGSITKVASVVVTGSHISVTPVPSTPSPGQIVTLNISATDNAGNAIPGVEVSLSGTAGASGKVTTDLSGGKTLTFIAPVAANNYTVVASGLNVTTTQTIVVIPAGGGTIPAAIGVLSASSVTPQPTSIANNTVGSTTNRSKLSAKFLSAGNVGIENMRVRFELVAPVLGNGEAISTGTATVYTNASGVAEADYIAGTRTSPTNGVLVRACYSATDFALSACPASVLANLTVAGSPLSISIGDDNTLAKGLGGIAYVKKYLIQVNDAAGVAVKDAVVSASVDITHYGKSVAWANPYRDVQIPTLRDVHSDFLPTTVPANVVQSLSASSYAPSITEKVWCINEDWNRNGFLDNGEDINTDGVIQPRKAEIVVSFVSSNKTDINGQLLAQISYAQNMGGWLGYTIRFTTSVAGSEGDASRSFVTGVLKEDVDNGSFLTPPFGSSSCNSPR